MKRLLLLVLTAVLALSFVGAETVEDLYAQVRENSTSFKEIQITRRNEFLDSVLAALTGPSWSISLQGLTIGAQQNLLQKPSLTLPSIEVGYSTPERDDKLAFEARLTINNQDYSWDSDKSQYMLRSPSISLKGGLSKTFEFKSWDDTDYSKGFSDIQRTNSYEISVLQFENTFLEAVIRILEWQKELNEKYIAKTRVEVSYKEALSSGKIKEGTPEDTQKKADVDVAVTEYNQTKGTGDELLSDFKKTYGVDFPETVEASHFYYIDYEPTVGGNSDVRSKYIDYITAQQKIDEKVGKSSRLSLSASLEPKVSFDDNFGYYDKASTSLGTSVNASYSTGNLSVDMSLSSDYELSPQHKGKFSNGPTFTVSASWSSTPSLLSKTEMERLKLQYTDKDGKLNSSEYERMLRELNNESLKKESLELEKLEASMLSAKKELEDEIAQYNKKATELKDEIKEFKNSYEILKIKTEANEKVLNQIEILKNEGKASMEDYYTALAAANSGRYDMTIASIKSHIIFNRIQIIEK